MITRASGQLEDLLEPRDLHALAAERRHVVAGVGLLDLGDRERLDRAAAVGRPVEPVVVERDDHAVLRDVGVGLQVRAPRSTAIANASSVFSGASPEAPRWATTIGVGASRKGCSRGRYRALTAVARESLPASR